MAFSRLTYTYTGTNNFALSFTLGYLNQSDITARVNDEEDGFGDPLYRNITFLTESTASIDGTLVNGDTVVFERTVSKTALQHDYEDEAQIIEKNLDESNLQTIMLVHEVLDGRLDSLATDLSLGTNRITDLGEPVDAQDAATKNYIDTFEAINTAAVLQAVDDAETAQAAAEAAQAAAEAAAGAVKVSANDTTAGDLETKLLVGDGLALSTQNDGANETRTIAHDFASQAEAEAGTATDKPMNALRTKQAIDAIVSSGLDLLASYTASNATSVDFGSGLDVDGAIDSTHDIYVIAWEELITANDAAQLYGRTSSDTGSTFDSGGSDYTYARFEQEPSTSIYIASNGTAAGTIVIIDEIGNTAGESCNGFIVLNSPSGTTITQMDLQAKCIKSGNGNIKKLSGMATRAAAAAVDAFRLYLNSGNITSGRFYLYGVRKS